jgi:DNA-binding NarL/FixJ family response regulator
LRAAPDIIRVGLVDDQTLVRQGLRLLIDAQPDMEVVAEAGDGPEALSAVVPVGAHVAIIETETPRVNEVELVDQLRLRSPNVQVIVLTRREGYHDVPRLVQAGVAAYLSKIVSAGDLLTAVRTVHGGGRVFEPRALDAVLRDYARRCHMAGASWSSGLTARERQVLRLVAEGHTNRETAELLRLSHKTVEAHRRNLMAKLGVHQATELVRHAIREGLVVLDPV